MARLGAAVFFVLAPATIAAATQPNIVWIVADDLGFADVPFTVNSPCNIRTPAISSLAAQGVVLDNYYVMHLCSPSRSAFMSGRHPIKTGLQHLVIYDSVPNGLPLNLTLLPRLLGGAGYSTAMIGKWHLGFHSEEYTPYNRGFDSFYGYFTGNVDYWNHTSPCFGCGNYSAYDLGSVSGPGQPFIPSHGSETGVYSTNLFGSKAVDVITGHDASSGPLFAYFAFEAVHGAASCDPNCYAPYGDLLQAPQEYIDRNPQIVNANRSVFGGMVSALDEAVGNITAALKAAGLWDNTVLLFTTDNGAPADHFDSTAMSNAPLRGAKAQLWEGGVRGAAFVTTGPGISFPAAGSRYPGLIHAVDWYTTFASLGGVPPTAIPPGTDGMDVWQAIAEGAASPRTEALIHIEPIAGWTALRSGDWKVLTGMPPGQWYPMAGEDGQARRVEHADQKQGVVLGQMHPSILSSSSAIALGLHAATPVYLFNLTADPEERNNVASSNAAVVQQLLDRIAAYNATAVPARFPAPDPAGNPAVQGRDYWAPWQA